MSRVIVRRWFRSWGRRQLYSLFSSLGTLLSHRVATLMTVLVLGIAMLLPIGFYVALDNLRAIDLQADEWGSITVFMHPTATEQDAEKLMQAINSHAKASAISVSPQQGMEEFRLASGFGEGLDVLESNPLPWVLLVRAEGVDDGNLAGELESLGNWLSEMDSVDAMQLDYKWLKRLSSLLSLGNALVSILGTLFSLAVVVVIANTIRMDVANHSDEIEVLSLVGAGDSFIRQPFLYSGFWYGLMGSVLALTLLSGSLHYLQIPLDGLLDMYGNELTLTALSASQVLLVMISGGALGFLGAWVSVERYLYMLRNGGLFHRI